MKVICLKAGSKSRARGRSFRPAVAPRHVFIRFEKVPPKAEIIPISFGPPLPAGKFAPLRRAVRAVAIVCGFFLLTPAFTPLLADSHWFTARHANMKRFYDEQHKPIPTLTEIKAAAEKGDVASQMMLAEKYDAQMDYATALGWYRKAATQGNTNAQYLTGDALLNGRAVNGRTAQSVAPDPNEAVIWLWRAANHGHALAQVALALCYREGFGVNQDLVEAFKWYALAAKQTNAAAVKAVQKLTLKLSTQEVAAAQTRANAFAPGQDLELPEPSYLGKLKLNGISGSRRNRLAIVNNHTLAINEAADIKLDARLVEVRCAEIHDASVVLQVGHYRKELIFRD